MISFNNQLYHFMKYLLLLMISIPFHLACMAQHQFTISEVPIFNSANDSIAYANLQAMLQRTVTEQPEFKKLNADSLRNEMRIITKRGMIGKKKTYHATSSFFPYDSLAFTNKPTQIKMLSLTDVKLKRLPKEVFKCYNLEALELVNTTVRGINKLTKLPKLRSIYILNNKQLKPIRLSKTKSLKTFGIRGENPTNCPGSFRKLRNLEKLDLADTKLTTFPTGIKRNKRLKEILLGNNNVTLDDGHMETSKSVEKLELQRNKIKALPASIGGFPNLKKLNLNFNLIEKVSDEIAVLSKLEQLSFYDNKLTSFPDGIYNLTGLKELDLYYNQIERINDRIANLKTLEVLYLSNNKLINLPEAIGSMHNLKEVFVSNNRLSELPGSLNKLHDLKVIRINNNYLTQLPIDLLKLNNLENIDISNNSITELPMEVLSLLKLKLIVIMNNPWDIQSKERLPSFIEQLRNKEVVIHAD